MGFGSQWCATVPVAKNVSNEHFVHQIVDNDERASANQACLAISTSQEVYVTKRHGASADATPTPPTTQTRNNVEKHKLPSEDGKTCKPFTTKQFDGRKTHIFQQKPRERLKPFEKSVPATAFVYCCFRDINDKDQRRFCKSTSFGTATST